MSVKESKKESVMGDAELRKHKHIKKAFLAKAKKEGIKVYKNNIHAAEPLEDVCGVIKTSHKADIDELLCGR